MLLLFLQADDRPDSLAQEWWRIDAAGRIVARGAGALGTDALGAGVAGSGGEPVIAVPPADAVSLHRISLPALAPAQAQAAARHLASERSAAPIDSLHTAISAREKSGAEGANGDGACWLAVADLAAMAGWQARLAAQDIAAPLVPLPLLLPDPALWHSGALAVVRDGERAFAAEPALLAVLMAEAPGVIDDAALARHVAKAGVLLDLRQGRFARRAAFAPARGQVRRLALLAAAAAALWVAGDAAAWWQLNRAAAAATAANAQLAAAMLPPGTAILDARAQVQALVARTQGGAASRLAGPLLASLASRPAVSIAALTLDDARLVATLEAASPGDVAAIESELRGRGLAADAGLPRMVAGRSQVALTVRRP